MHRWGLDKMLIVYPKAQRYNIFLNKINPTLFKYATFVLNQQPRPKYFCYPFIVRSEVPVSGLIV